MYCNRPSLLRRQVFDARRFAKVCEQVDKELKEQMEASKEQIDFQDECEKCGMGGKKCGCGCGEGEGEGEEKNDEGCTICLESGKPMEVQACGHSFCQDCAHQWKAVNKRNDCPICRQPMEMEKVSEWRRQYLSSVRMMTAQVFNAYECRDKKEFVKSIKTWEKGLVSLLKVMYSLHFHYHPEDLVKPITTVKEIYRDHRDICYIIPTLRFKNREIVHWDPWPMDYILTHHEKLKVSHFDEIEFMVQCAQAFRYNRVREIKAEFN